MIQDCPIANIAAATYTIPTDAPEADGTLAWDKTTLVLVTASAGGQTGIGYTYADAAVAQIVNATLAASVEERDAFDTAACWHAMRRAARNLGLSGEAGYAIAAIDTALWDLKARLLGLPLAALFGQAQASVTVYGSGGFTTYTDAMMAAQIEGWRAQGITGGKIKIGAHPEHDLARAEVAKRALGDATLFVDANGAYTVKQALRFAEAFRDLDIAWFEEPVSSDDLAGLRLLRDRAPAGMDIAAGEYGSDIFYFKRMLDAGSVDVLQIDATRAQGYTGFLQVAALAFAAGVPVSSHCAPALHLPVCAHLAQLRHMEYFHDHARIERLLFDGVPAVVEGAMAPDRSAPGNGLTFRQADAERYAA